MPLLNDFYKEKSTNNLRWVVHCLLADNKARRLAGEPALKNTVISERSGVAIASVRDSANSYEKTPTNFMKLRALYTALTGATTHFIVSEYTANCCNRGY